MAIAGLGGTSVANLDSRASKKLNNATVKTIAGITKLSYFEWPITEDYASYIQAQILPHIDIENFSLTNEWTLRNNQKYGKKGSGKRMTATVKAYLEEYFLSGNVNKTDRMSAKDIVKELQNLAKEGEIQLDDVLKIKTVEGWIARFLSSLRKEYAV
ncbi:unnamed protein product [Rhizophagus irregularis]|nr:unnamed protein product [Rhizophagus irregularis]CAB5394562.1 unnamed protein product [Rhizophagus irregularis]